jgi:membrane-associated protein
MEWKRFVLANAAGAAVWVTTIALLGYTFGSEFERVMAFFDRAGLALLAAALLGGWWLWRRRRRQSRERRIAALESSTINR